MLNKLLSMARNTGVTPVNFAIVVAVLALFHAFPRALIRVFRFAEGLPAIGIAFVFPLAIRMALLPWMPIPEPKIHDEFSFLLAADTFAHGRLTNPTHPLWEFFESFHVFHQPTYMSMYAPAQGMILAFGKVVFGHPWWGEFLSMGAMCAAVCWMLLGWEPKRWALLGALAAGLQYCVAYYWMNSYWGAAAAATGGALLYGALGRLIRHNGAKVRYGVIIAIAVALLANSRPWEGLILCIPAALVLVQWLMALPDRAIRLRRVALPCASVLFVVGLSMMYYCWRITGDPLKLPYMHDRDLYATTPYFLWQHEKPAPAYHHEVMRKLYTEWEPEYQDAFAQGEFNGWLHALPFRYRAFKDSYLSNALTLLILVFAFPMWRNSRSRILLFSLLVFFGGLAMQRYYASHYFAPVLAVTMALKLTAIRRLYAWSRPLVLALLLCCAVTLVRSGFQEAHAPQPPFPRRRAEIIQRLVNTLGEHVVIVRYAPDHPIYEEWVYNGADIDSQHVVWARDMGAENERLRAYYRNRRFWLLEPERSMTDLVPLDSGTSAPVPASALR